MTPNDDFRYWAFISYSSMDTGIAIRLHRALERYRLPRALLGRPTRDGEPLPRSLFPIFRDRDELPLSSDLGSSIQDALRASRFLIVIASPDAAQSRWVNEEIRYFRTLGREDRILVIIVRGEPNASDDPARSANECFPPALRYRVGPDGQLTGERSEPIAGDLRRAGDGWTACVLKAVAGMTGLGFNAFARRERTRKRHRWIAGATLSALLLGGVIGWWDHTRVKVTRFAHLTERFGVPEGAVPLDDATAMRRARSFMIESSRGKVRRVMCVNGSDWPISCWDQVGPIEAAVREMSYRDDGQLESITLRGPGGQILARIRLFPQHTDQGLVLFSEVKADYEDAPMALISGFVSDSSELFSRSEISVIRSLYREDGLPSQRTFLNAYRQPRANAYGLFGERYKYDERRLTVESQSLDLAERPRPDQTGVETIRHQRTGLGDIQEEAFFGPQELPVYGSNGWHKRQLLLDEAGNVIEERLFNPNDEPVVGNDGYARATFRYDERGNKTERAVFDVDGQPVLDKDGVARWTSRFDERGYHAESAFFGVDGKPVLDKNGVARWTYQYDARGNENERAGFGIDGQPVLNRDGYARVTSRFDERGNEIERAVFGVDGRPVLNRDGYARATSLFDERGNRTEVDLFGVDGKPVLDKNGAARVTFRYDERGNPIEMALFGVDGKPVLDKNGVARSTFHFDERGNHAETAFFGVDGQPVLDKDGVARWTSRFDERGYHAESAFFGVDGKPVLDKNGVARWTSRYNERGNLTEVAVFGADGKPVLDKNGSARWTYQYDERGNETEVAFFGVDGAPVLNVVGTHRRVALHDARGNEIQVTRFGIAGEPVSHANGYHIEKTRIDDRGNVVEKSWYDLQGNPVINLDDEYGAARITFVYDARGNPIETNLYGPDGKLMNGPDGWAREANEYQSATGTLLGTAHFDANGRHVEVSPAVDL